jgi:hypothetical protein
MNDSLNSLTAESDQHVISQDEISRRAQQLWEEYGRPVGRDEEIWLQAERDLKKTSEPTPAQVLQTEVPAVMVTPNVTTLPPSRTKVSATPRKSAVRSSKAAAR